MKTTTTHKFGITLAGVLAFTLASAHADTFGTGPNQFTIDFVDIGNVGNADDVTGFSYTADGGLYGSGTSFGLGGVPYQYRMGTFEISEDMITKSGLESVTAGAWTGSQPAGFMTWFEAAAFVNWLNMSKGHQAAYLLLNMEELMPWGSGQAWQLGGENRYRHKDAYYFLPSEDEWYKAAYHKNDGVTANYWDYATGSNTAPTAVASGTASGTAVYNNVTNLPAAMNNAGGLSAYGTMGQGGNVWEWLESASDGINNSSPEYRTFRGGSNFNSQSALRSSSQNADSPTFWNADVGFRVASVPEPSSTVLMLSASVFALARRRRRAAF